MATLIPKRVLTQIQPLIVPFILVLALLVRLPLLTGSLWLDEAAQALLSTRPLSQQLAIQADFQPPLYHLVVHIIALVSHAEWWLRLASLIPALVTIYLTFLLGRTVHSPKVGYLSAFALSLSHMHLYFSQELRPYQFASVFVLVSFLILSKPPSRQRLWALSVVNACGLLSVYTYVFYLICQGIYASKHPSKTQLWLKSLLISGGFTMWWLPFFIGQLTTGLALKAAVPGWDQVVSLPFLKALPTTLVKLYFGRFPIPNHLASYLTLGLLLLGIGVVTYRNSSEKIRRLLLVALLPLLLSWLSTPLLPTLEPKRFLSSLPFLLVGLVAAALTSPWAKGLLAIVLGTNALVIAAYWITPDLQREPWREVVHSLETQFQSPSSIVVFRFDAPLASWQWYHSGSLTGIATGSLYVSSPASLNANLNPVKDTHTVLVFDYLKDLTDPHDFVAVHLTTQGFYETERISYPNIGAVRQYSRQPLYAHYSPTPSYFLPVQ